MGKLSILCVKGDLEIWHRVLLIASFPMLLGNELSPRLLLCFSTLSKREDAKKDSLGESLTSICSYGLPHLQILSLMRVFDLP